MKKLLDMTGMELMAAMAELANPIGNLANDDEIFEALNTAAKTALKRPKHQRMREFMTLFADVVPLLLSKEHATDLLKIISVVTGRDPKDALDMNGADMFAEMIQAWKEQLYPFLLRCGFMEDTK